MARDEHHWVAGIHSVEALLQHNSGVIIKKLFLQEGRQDKRFKGISRLAERANILVERVEKQALNELLGAVNHQGVAAQVLRKSAWHEQDLDQLLKSSAAPFLLILDGVTDPHNLGACLRSANGAGVDAVIVPKDNAAGLNPTARKVASGAAEITPFIRVTNLARTIRKLKESGVWIIGASDSVSEPIYAIDLKGPIAIILGAEGKGLRSLTQSECDYLVSIPMKGQVSSLNVSVAAGICLFEAVRQRS